MIKKTSYIVGTLVIMEKEMSRKILFMVMAFSLRISAVKRKREGQRKENLKI